MKVDVNIVSKINQEKQLLIADMDSTLINQECIDELAKFTGFSDKVFKITKEAMNGKILFTESLIKRTELLKGTNLDILAWAKAHRPQISCVYVHIHIYTYTHMYAHVDIC